MRPSAHDPTRARRLVLACVVVPLVFVVAIGSAAARESQQLTPVEIALIAVEPTAQALYAEDMGFFAKHGIDARINILPAAQSIPAIISGQVAFAAIPTGGLANLKAQGAPVKLVAAGALYVPDRPASWLVAGPGKRVALPRDLVGKRVAIDFQTSIAHLTLLHWLKRGGVTPEQVKLSIIPFPRMLGPLTSGQVTAAVLPEPYVTQVVSRGAKKAVNIFKTVCSANCVITTWMARRDVDPSLAARFRLAVQEAGAWANKAANEGRSAEILAKYTELERSLIARSTRTKYASRLKPALAQPWIDLYIEFGLVPDGYSAQDLVK